MLIARRYRVSGRVQGVGFRYFADEAARREAIGGYVRNCADRTVEVFAEGEREALLRFERALRAGPPGARVDDVEVTECEPSGRVPHFRVTG